MDSNGCKIVNTVLNHHINRYYIENSTLDNLPRTIFMIVKNHFTFYSYLKSIKGYVENVNQNTHICTHMSTS